MKRGGMCCTTTMPGTVAGRRPSTCLMASVPPVLAPMATILWVRSTEVMGAATMAEAVSPAGRARGRALAAARIFSASCSAISPTLKEPPGLDSTSTAPASMASRARRPPFWVREERMITGMGRCCISLRRKVRPSMRGISMSRVMTSGSSWTILSRAT